MNKNKRVYEIKALELDQNDPLKAFRDEFSLPEKIYLCHNSLGLPPKKTIKSLEEQVKKWSDLGVEAWFQGKKNWYNYIDTALPKSLSNILGATEKEVTVMNSLTVNLHLLFVSFYRPTKTKYKILIDAPTFPSDRYAIESQLKFHGFDVNDALVVVRPRQGEHIIRHEDLLNAIKQHSDSLALIFLNGVNYLTGQLLNMKAITRASHEHNIPIGYDLAHAAGNVLLMLHEWNIDFALGCTYKYLCSGPGGPGYAFIHEKHHKKDLPRFAGWWGNDPETRFQMNEQFIPVQSASGWNLSTPNILGMTPLLTSLELYKQAGMDNLTQKSELQFNFLVEMLESIDCKHLEIITPKHKGEHGSQVSLLIHQDAERCQKELEKCGVICDFRRPNIVRAAPSPFYTSFYEIYQFVERLSKIL